MPRHKSSDKDFMVGKDVIVIDDGDSLAAKRPRRKASIPAQQKVAALARSEENPDDDDDVVIVSESRITPRRNTTPQHRSPGRPRRRSSAPKPVTPVSITQGRGRPARIASIEIDLNMECMEEALSPYQIQAAKRAEQEYKDALAKIKSAQAKIAAEQQAQIAEQRRQRKQQWQLQQQQQKQQQIQQKQAQQPISIAPGTAYQPASNNGVTRTLQPSQVVPPYGQHVITGNTGALYTNIHSPAKPQGAAVRPPVWTSRAQQDANRGQLSITNPVSLSPNPVAEPVQSVVRGTYGLGIKRSRKDIPVERAASRRSSTGSGSSSTSSGKKQNESGNWVPLDEYYYGKKEGDPTYREDKGEFRFKCWYCHKMLYNNLRMMLHMQGHIDSEKQQNLDLSDLTQCKHCFKQFDTPFDMQCHIERVHQNKGNVLVCRICDKDHDNQASLRQHMRNYHSACEMPYICQLCNFRSSVYSDVVDHFKKRHDSSQHTLCLYCLRVFKINFSKNSGWGLTQNYYQHLQKHQVGNKKKKCQCCKLTFLSATDVKSHKSKDHLPNHKGAGLKAPGTPSQEQVMIQLTDTGNKTGNKPKSLNAQSVSKVRDLRGIRLFNNTLVGKTCYECKYPMEMLDHFKRYVECSMCRYATTCNNAYSNHMISFHSGNQSMRNKAAPKEQPMDHEMFCLCGFSSKLGNKIANHLVFCSKRTSYSNKPEPKWFEYDDEQEEFNPFEPYVEEPDVPDVETPGKDRELTLLGVLGLVKKKADSSSPEPEELSGEKVVGSVIDSILDAAFPAASAAGDAINQILDNVNSHITLKDKQKADEALWQHLAAEKEVKGKYKRRTSLSLKDDYMSPTKKRKTSQGEPKSASKIVEDEWMSVSGESKSLEADEPMEIEHRSVSPKNEEVTKEERSGSGEGDKDDLKMESSSDGAKTETAEDKESDEGKDELMETDMKSDISDDSIITDSKDEEKEMLHLDKIKDSLTTIDDGESDAEPTKTQCIELKETAENEKTEIQAEGHDEKDQLHEEHAEQKEEPDQDMKGEKHLLDFAEDEKKDKNSEENLKEHDAKKETEPELIAETATKEVEQTDDSKDVDSPSADVASERSPDVEEHEKSPTPVPDDDATSKEEPNKAKSEGDEVVESKGEGDNSEKVEKMEDEETEEQGDDKNSTYKEGKIEDKPQAPKVCEASPQSPNTDDARGDTTPSRKEEKMDPGQSPVMGSQKEKNPEESTITPPGSSTGQREEVYTPAKSERYVPKPVMREMSSDGERSEVHLTQPRMPKTGEVNKTLSATEDVPPVGPSYSTEASRPKVSDPARPSPAIRPPLSADSGLSKPRDEQSTPREREQSRSSKFANQSHQSSASQDYRRRDEHRSSSSNSSRFDDRRHGYRDDRGHRDDYRDNRHGGRNWYDQRQSSHDNRQGRYDDRYRDRGHHGQNRGGYGGYDRHDRRDYGNHGNNRGHRGGYGNRGGGGGYGNQNRYQGGYY